MRSFFAVVMVFAGLVHGAMCKDVPLTYPSPDGRLTAVVVPTGRDAGAKQIDDDSASGNPLEYECRVEMRNTKPARKIWSEDFSSPDADHGRGVAFARWSPDGRYFVFSTVSSGGHHPWQYYTYAWSRQQQRLYLLDGLVGEVIAQGFTFRAPDRLMLQVLDRTALKRNPNLAFPARQVSVNLGALLAHQVAPSKPTLVHPPTRGSAQ